MNIKSKLMEYPVWTGLIYTAALCGGLLGLPLDFMMAFRTWAVLNIFVNFFD